MESHVKVLGVLHIVSGIVGLLIALLMLILFGGLATGIGLSEGADAAAAVPILSLLGGGLALFITILSAPSILVGWGLMRHRPWARILGLILSALELLNFPLGTALGIYGFWVLLNSEAEALFRDTPVYQT